MARTNIRAPMTAAERQQLERERNRRARQAVLGLESFSLDAVDWERQQVLSRQEILGATYMLAKWAIHGSAFVDETRLTLPPERRAFTANVFDKFNIDLPFCRSCGADLIDDTAGRCQRLKCKSATQRDLTQSKGRSR